MMIIQLNAGVVKTSRQHQQEWDALGVIQFIKINTQIDIGIILKLIFLIILFREQVPIITS